MYFGATLDELWSPFEHVPGRKEFLKFKEKFGVVGRCYLGENLSVSAPYFLKLLQKGNVRAKISTGDEDSKDFWYPYNYGSKIFDHSELWKTKKGKLFCTSAPYQISEKTTLKDFHKLLKTFSYPDTIKLEFLPEKYRFRPNNGTVFFAIFDEIVCEFIYNILREDRLVGRKLKPYTDNSKIPKWRIKGGHY